EYHLTQHKKIYASTEGLVDFYRKENPAEAATISDVGCGAGANTYFLARQFAKSRVKGLDISPELIALAKDLRSAHEGNPLPNFSCADLLADSFASQAEADAVFAFQLLSWVPSEDIYKPLAQVAQAARKTLAFSCLIFDGPMDVRVHINDWSNPQNVYSVPYNILSLERIRELLGAQGFKKISYEKWVMPFPLTTTARGVGSRTVDTVDGERLILSGPLHLPYGFVVAQR
ncbi:MAG: class I SAM-dependent methyltransferase, partial [Bdellovibrionota bacterium]